MNTAQVAGSTARGFVVEFIVEDEAGDPESYRALRIFRPDSGLGEPLADRMMHGTGIALCLFRCFLACRDLSENFQLEQSWGDGDDEVDFGAESSTG